jgi:type VI protein secretion system component VasK
VIKRKRNEEILNDVTKKWSVNGTIERNKNTVFYTKRNVFKKKIITKIKNELNWLLIIGPKASGKSSTILDLQYDFEESLFF